MSEEEKLDQDRKDALTLVSGLWYSIDWERVPQRLMPKIYSIFSDWIQESAYTGSLSSFVENFQQAGICTVVPGDWAEQFARIINSGRDRQILRVLREETAALVIYMRARRDASKEAKRKEFLESRSPEELEHIRKFEELKEKEAKKRR